VLLILSIISITTLTLTAIYTRIESMSADVGGSVGKLKSHHMAEGIVRVASRLAQDYIALNPGATATDITNHVVTNTSALNVSPYSLSNFEFSVLSGPITAPVPSGTFEGVESFQMIHKIKAKVEDAGTGVMSAIEQEAILAKFSMFQFAMFGDLPTGTTYLTPGLPMDINGRIHINGDFCVGNFGNLASDVKLGRVTISGTLAHLHENRCWTGSITASNRVKIATDPGFTTFAYLVPGATSGCTNCDGTGLNWKSYSETTFKGNARDLAHNTSRLKLPLPQTALVQSGADALDATVDNTGSSRILIDPVMPADAQATKEEKYAHKADIRIINGVWFLKDPTDAFNWPGIPIWSDHPGRFNNLNEEGFEGTDSVGQDDLRDLWNATVYPWPAGVPGNYSYYEYDPGTSRIYDNTAGVISYGSLFRVGGSPVRWNPGHWADVGTSALCQGGNTCTNCSTSLIKDALDLTAVVCGGGPAPERDTFLLNGTRSGIRDGHVLTRSAPGNFPPSAIQIDRSKIFPANFDVVQFQAALGNTGSGELG